MNKSEIRQLIRKNIKSILAETMFVSKKGELHDRKTQDVTKAKINKAIQDIEAEKKTLPEFSPEGDPNWEMCDAQISILRGEKTSRDFPHNINREDNNGIDPVELAARTAQRFKDGVIEDMDDDFFMDADIDSIIDNFESRNDDDDDIIYLSMN